MNIFHRFNSVLSFISAALVLALFPSCEKEEGADIIRLHFEKYNGSKVAVSDCVSTWIEGDEVRINSTVLPVVYNNGEPCLHAASESVNRAIYPATLVSGPLVTDNIHVVFPSTYHYAYDAGANTQRLETPLAGRGEGSGGVFFKHLGSAVCLVITNGTDRSLTIDAATLSSNVYQLSGGRDIALDNIGGLTHAETGTLADRSVSMLFDGGYTLSCGEEMSVMIPILPVGEANRFTVTITAHAEGTRYTYSRSQPAESSSNHTILRNQLAYAPLSIDMSDGHTMTEGLFEIEAGGSSSTALIRTPYEFATMVQALNNNWQHNGTNYRELNYSIENDLDMTGYIIQPIDGRPSAYIKGIDFNGHTVSNLTIESAIYGGSAYQCGLFYGRVRGNLDGLTLDNLILRHKGEVSGKNLFMGAICSDAETPAGSTTYTISINSCSVSVAAIEMEGITPGISYFGGMFGRIAFNSSPVELNHSNVHLAASIKANNTVYAGGLIGMRKGGTIKANYCTLSGTINATTATARLGKYLGYSTQAVTIETRESSAGIVFSLNGVEQGGVPDYSTSI